MDTSLENRCFEWPRVPTASSARWGLEMTFGLFLPAEAGTGRSAGAVGYFGLTCTHANAMDKAGAAAMWCRRTTGNRARTRCSPDKTRPAGAAWPTTTAYDLGLGAEVLM